MPNPLGDPDGADLRARRGFAMSGTPGATLETSYSRAMRVHELHRQDARRNRKGGLLTGEGGGRLKLGRDGDDPDAAGVGCYRNSSSAGPRWVGLLVPERAFDPDRDLGHREDPSLVVAVVAGSLSAIANASWVDSSARSKSPT